MFGFLKSDPSKKLKQKYDKTLEQAMMAQRNGDMRLYAKLTEEAETLWHSIEALRANAVER